VRIDRETLEPRFKVIGSDLWSDEPGFDAATAATGITGVCGSGIIEVIAEMYLAGIINQDGVLDGRLAARSSRIVENGELSLICCIKARWRDEDHPKRRSRDSTGESGAVCRRRAAHGTARYRSRRSYRLAGPSAATSTSSTRRFSGWFRLRSQSGTFGRQCRRNGARIALLDATSRGVIEALVRRIEKVETAIEPRFKHHFVEAMRFPTRPRAMRTAQGSRSAGTQGITSQSETRGRRPRRTDPLKTD